MWSIVTFGILASNLNTSFYYLIFIGTIFTTSIFKIVNLRFSIRLIKLQFLDLIPGGFLLIWFYGMCLGLLNDNKIEFIVRNFAGMTLYLIYYVFLNNKTTKETIFRVVYSASIIVIINTIILSILANLLNINIFKSPIIQILFGELIGGSSTGQSRIFFVGQIVIFVASSVTASRLIQVHRYSKRCQHSSKTKWINNFFKLKSRLLAIVIIIVSFYALLIVPASKGYFLGAICLSISLAVGLQVFRLKKKGHLLYLTIAIVLITFLFILGYENIASAIFDKNDIANIARYKQLEFLLNDITVFGKGLGAEVPGYFRNDKLPYGFELIYVNLFHKFGIFATVLVSNYIYSFYQAAKSLQKKEIELKYSAASLGAMCFIFPSLGNPLLYHPQLVILHCFALLLIRK